MGFVEKKSFIFLMIGKMNLSQIITDNLWQPGTYIGCIFKYNYRYLFYTKYCKFLCMLHLKKLDDDTFSIVNQC